MAITVITNPGRSALRPKISSTMTTRCAKPFAYCEQYTAPTPMGKNPARIPATAGFGPAFSGGRRPGTVGVGGIGGPYPETGGTYAEVGGTYPGGGGTEPSMRAARQASQ